MKKVHHLSVLSTKEKKMAVRLLFPTHVFHRNLLQEGLDDSRGVTEEYLGMLKDEMDAMRKRDPVGRQLSNAYTGWQSKDGCESSPIFQKLINRIEHLFYDEVFPFNGLNPQIAHMRLGNCWANINDFLAWNKPHLHNGCWYSGVFYIHADGDEGCFTAVDTHSKVVADFPHSPRAATSWDFEPKSGELVLFPSGLMHMVEPNPTKKDRYSVSFNIEMHYDTPTANAGEIEDYNPNEFVFDLDERGNPIF